MPDALPGADLVVLALALTPETEGIIGADELQLMEDHAWLINVARGRHVVTDDLVDALRDGVIGGAGLDVTDPEPLPPDHPLWSLPNCLITPHVGQHPGDGGAAAGRADHGQRPPLRRRRGAARPGRRRSRILTGGRAMVSGELDAAAIVGLLADDDRRRVVAALTLGPRDLSGVVAATGLPADRVDASARSARRGRVGGQRRRRVAGGRWATAFQRAARAALARPPRSEHAGEPEDRRKVLDAFVHDGASRRSRRRAPSD